eukprot:TRINITY_DN67744_c4_g12_i1.p1 TRINITY_DN67744_c4_g12~~TRINITY_DN67744_c4_g12_i1.p1  ORF type:complete len:187 (-),score=2.34 TRINITY_DN67744_c4_g12_i1:69-629(-)
MIESTPSPPSTCASGTPEENAECKKIRMIVIFSLVGVYGGGTFLAIWVVFIVWKVWKCRRRIRDNSNRTERDQSDADTREVVRFDTQGGTAPPNTPSFRALRTQKNPVCHAFHRTLTVRTRVTCAYDLPTDCVWVISAFLDEVDLHAMAAVCNKWNSVDTSLLGGLTVDWAFIFSPVLSCPSTQAD